MTPVRTWRKSRVAAVLLCLNGVSALLFILLVNHPVFDDKNNLPDVYRYADSGVSLTTLRQHRNPTGPGSFLWMASAVHFAENYRLVAARLAVLSSWLLLGVGILVGARRSRYADVWMSALIVTLVFPHTVTASATVLTEGPALLFAAFGAFLWMESIAQPSFSPKRAVGAVLGGIFIGLAVICRQYYLALIPAAIVVTAYEARRDASKRNSSWFLVVAASLAAAVIPVALLFFAWGGLSSPAMVIGTSYTNWQSRTGLNLFRPVICAFNVLVYLALLILPGVSLSLSKFGWRPIVFALFAGTAGAPFSNVLLQPGPLRSIALSAGRIPMGQLIFCGLLIAMASYTVSVLWVLAKQFALPRPSLPAVFSLFIILFFIGEQIGVGGNIPFYERYILQVAPFMGILAFSVLPELPRSRLLSLILLSAASHTLLWRYAFS